MTASGPPSPQDAALLHRTARQCGIEEGYHDIWGTYHRTDTLTEREILRGMGLPVDDPPALARECSRLDLVLRPAQSPSTDRTPGLTRGHEPQFLLDGGRTWGINLPLYAVTSSRNWGVGDFEDLRHAMGWAAGLGADFVGLLPLHALPNEDPHGISPYYPSSRLFLNGVYIAVDEVPEAQDPRVRERCADGRFRRTLDALRGAELVDYEAVWACKRSVLELCHRAFMSTHLPGGDDPSPRGEQFLAWKKTQGVDLEDFCRFNVLRQRMRTEIGTDCVWQRWPKAWRTPQRARATPLRPDEQIAMEFEAYLQWLAESQLAEARRAGLASGMRLGLYTDLALGVDPSGADAWVHQDVLASGVSAGAPPDPFSLLGQRWGVPPTIPHRQRDSNYRFFLDTLRHNAARSDALRVDHVMAWWRLFWVPNSLPASRGAYVLDFPEELLPLARQVSREEECLIVGEDLGTVPPRVRAELDASGFFSYRLLIFEKDGNGHFRPPNDYPRQGLVAVSTHDLPPLDGFWTGCDLELKRRLHRYPDPETAATDAEARRWDRLRLLEAVAREGLLPAGMHPCHDPPSAWLNDLAVAVHGFLARSPAALMLVNGEDLLAGQQMQNLPGTLQEHPNWQRKLEVPLEEWPRRTRPYRVAEAIATAGRGRPCLPAAQGDGGPP